MWPFRTFATYICNEHIWIEKKNHPNACRDTLAEQAVSPELPQIAWPGGDQSTPLPAGYCFLLIGKPGVFQKCSCTPWCRGLAICVYMTGVAYRGCHGSTRMLPSSNPGSTRGSSMLVSERFSPSSSCPGFISLPQLCPLKSDLKLIIYNEKTQGAGFWLMNPTERQHGNSVRASVRAGFLYHHEWGIFRSVSSPGLYSEMTWVVGIAQLTHHEVHGGAPAIPSCTQGWLATPWTPLSCGMAGSW